MNTVKGSTKELFRQMKEELNYRSNSKEMYEIFSSDSSEQESKDYYDEMKYLKKDQLKAYICKLRKEIKNYKIKEMNFIIEIKYLRRKIIRLKNVIDSDKIFKYQRNSSLRSDGSQLNSLRNNFCNYNIKNSEKSFKQNYFTYQNNATKSTHCNLKFRNFSIRSINDSIHNSRRRSVKDYDSCRDKYTDFNNNKVVLRRNTSKSISNTSFYKDKERYNDKNSFYMGCRNKMNSHDNIQKKNYFPNRSFSSITKFELKKNLLFNNKNNRNLSSEINNTIAKDIKNYYSSKESILSNNQINAPRNKLFKKFSFNNSDKRKITPTSFNVKNIKKNYNCDIYNYNHHQSILNKKYSSPYAYKKSKLINNTKKSEENIKSVGSEIIELPLSDNDSKKNNLKNKKNNNEKKEISSTNNRIYMENENEKKNIKGNDSSISLQNIKTYLGKEKKKKNSSNTYNKENVLKKKGVKEKVCVTKLKNKNDQKYSENHNNRNPVNTQNGLLKKEEIEKKQSNLLNLKKNIDLEIKENFRKELEQLKNRSNKLISKPNNFYNFSVGISSSSDSSNTNNNGKKINLKKSIVTYKTNNNPLKESNLLNISFNDIDKRISNLQNYLKNTRK